MALLVWVMKKYQIYGERREKMELNSSVVIKASKERTKILEEYIKLHIQPKPKWLPQFIWYKILKRLLILDIRLMKREL